MDESLGELEGMSQTGGKSDLELLKIVGFSHTKVILQAHISAIVRDLRGGML